MHGLYPRVQRAPAFADGNAVAKPEPTIANDAATTTNLRASRVFILTSSNGEEAAFISFVR
jgi:hypothetical protein